MGSWYEYRRCLCIRCAVHGNFSSVDLVVLAGYERRSEANE